MHVKIGYSIDLKDVPTRVTALMEEIKEIVERDIPQKYRVSVHTLKESPDCSETIEKINKLRESLFSVDMRMADCASILKGYQDASATDPAAVESPPAHTPVIPSKPKPTIESDDDHDLVLENADITKDQAQEVIDKFKEQMGEYTKNFVPPATDPSVPSNPEEQAAAAMSMFQDMLNKKQ